VLLARNDEMFAVSKKGFFRESYFLLQLLEQFFSIVTFLLSIDLQYFEQVWTSNTLVNRQTHGLNSQ